MSTRGLSTGPPTAVNWLLMSAEVPLKRTQLSLVVAALILATALNAQTPPASSTSAQVAVIQAEIQSQSDAWNRGDIPAFMETYENSPDTTFIGATVRKGYDTILQRY